MDSVADIISSVESAAKTYYFRLGYGRTGRPCLTLLGNGLEVDEDDTASTLVYKASAIGISLDDIYAYLAVTEDLNDHVRAYGHHEGEIAETEENQKYDNIKHVIQCMEDTWNGIAEGLAAARG